MCGPGGAENRKHARRCSEKQIFEGSKGGSLGKVDSSPAVWDPIRGHFGVTLPTLGSLWGHFGFTLGI